jgi:type VI secretion system protein ImpG
VRDELLSYYERELTFLRQMGVEFAEKYPKIASRLLLEANQCDDPHVERLLESFAFLAARVHLKIDDEFPEITEALLSIVYPHFIRPIPSMTIVEFHGDPDKGGISAPLPIPRGAMLSSRPVDGLPCRFRVCYDTIMWPLLVREAQWTAPDRLQPPVRSPGSAAALRVAIKCGPDAKLDQLKIKDLRFYLNGEGHLIHTMYEVLCANTTQILVRDINPNSRKKPLTLPASALKPAGFSENEAILPYPLRSFEGYRLIQEYFHFPEKFFFIDVTGLDGLATSGFQDGFELIFLLSPFERSDRQQSLEVGVSNRTMRLNCSPIVNLFPQTAEPILLKHTKTEYPIIPDVRRPFALEMFSVNEVLSANPQTAEVTRFEPFYSYRHGTIRDKQQTFWHAVRRPSMRRNDDGTEMFLSLVDLSGRPMRPEFDAVTVKCSCTNRDIPARLPFGNEAGDFDLEGFAPVRRVLALRKPTTTLRPPVSKGALWRLLSHLSLNYLSLVEDGKDALQEVLRLYDFGNSAYLQKQIAGITQLQSKRHFARIVSENGIAFARGMRVHMEFDEDQFVGGGVYLFASVLERFLGLYASLNSFSQLVATTRQRKEAMKEWPPRAGLQILM